MAACGSLQHIFKKPLPENPTLLESLSPWNQIQSPKPIDDSSFTEIFGELHFKEMSDQSLPPSSSSPLPLTLSSSSSSLSSSSSSTRQTPKANAEKPENSKTYSPMNPSSDYFPKQYVGSHKASDSFSSMNSESLQLCTEGLGFESSDEVEELKTEMGSDWQSQEERISIRTSNSGEIRRSMRTTGRTFPPPISSIGKSGKPWVCFKSYRQDGRFVLKEIRMPTHEFLHATREDGRLKLQLCLSDDEILEDDERDEEEEEEEDDDIDTKEEKRSGQKNVKLDSNGGRGDS